jgi:hypothetical protein
MKNKILSLVVLAAIATSVATAQTSAYPVQPEFPRVLFQPEDQLVPIGSSAMFFVVATNGPLAYQWRRNGSAIYGQTNDTLVIPNAQISDVGYYSCYISKYWESVPTRAASLMVFTSSIDPDTGVDPVTVFGLPLPGGGSQGTCPGPFAGYVNYTKTLQQGWGWAPDTTNGNTIFTAVDTNRMDTKIQYGGAYGDAGCNQTSVTVPYPTYSPLYRFTIYFTNNVPTNAYAITLNGFKP